MIKQQTVTRCRSQKTTLQARARWGWGPTSPCVTARNYGHGQPWRMGGSPSPESFLQPKKASVWQAARKTRCPDSRAMRDKGVPAEMECGDMRTLSGIKYRRCTSASATPRGPSVIKKPTPRARSSGTVGIGGLGGGAGAGGEVRGTNKHIPSPWTPPADLHPNPYFHQSPRIKVASRLTMASRDKESLLDEIIQLKKELIQQGEKLRMKNARSSAVEHRNRKLEMDVCALETTLNVDAPRTGSPHRLRAKLQSLQLTVEQLQDTCDAQREELQRLRCDIRATRTREVEVERDVFANEVKRLQKAIKRLQTIQNRISCENRDLGRFKTKCQKLEIVNQRLESCITAKSIKPQAQPQNFTGPIRHNMVHFDHSHTPRRDRSRLGSRQGPRPTT
ncbi:hypothetical protein MPTK1_2g04130 [Marchantia polymorpha subsp. ruderalis]|uniref:Uncharacterized protein n=1 Tax=Marchantia polymorpha TaxID=3197 RepID=A0A2R6X7M3_MARPO|nr:hypothetical protein MARPO_0031s0069 [Marchantia polymorpha]BBN01044.1 hypothetical protein Mp_2g04130 [Marchantia polymorpha subsp. ruderalis]|eukprot:PTQ42093.1 hypothetical protein MARPO_0031s0069 [Marchantia polymorpha]